MAKANKVVAKKATKKVEPQATIEPKEFRIEQLPLDALKGIVDSAEEAAMESVKEEITELLLDFSPSQQREIMEDVQRNLRRDVDTRVTSLRREIDKLQRD